MKIYDVNVYWENEKFLSSLSLESSTRKSLSKQKAWERSQFGVVMILFSFLKERVWQTENSLDFREGLVKKIIRISIIEQYRKIENSF